MNKNCLISGSPISIPELNVSIYQPTIQDIIDFGELEFNKISSIFTFNKNNLIDKGEDVNTFELLIILLYKDIEFAEMYLPKFFNLILPGYKLNKLEKSGFIFFGTEGKVLILNKMNFDTFREVLIEIFSVTKEKRSDFNPKEDSEKAKEIAEKLRKARSNSQKGEGENPTLADYVTILSVGLNSYTIDDILKLTFYQFSKLLDRFILYYNFDIDIRCKLAGSGAESEVDNWMKSN